MPAIPALPDTERRTRYVIVTPSVGPHNVAFDIYADGADYANWLEVWDDGVKLTPVTDWIFDSAGFDELTGSLSTIGRPITDGRITFTSVRSGTIDIVGARRPRRTSQYDESSGITAHDENQVHNDLMATMREDFDRLARTPMVIPGETIGQLPKLSDRQGSGQGSVGGYDSAGNPKIYPVTIEGTFTDDQIALKAAYYN